MTRYDLGYSEEELNRTQPMPPLATNATEMWTPGDGSARRLYLGGKSAQADRALFRQTTGGFLLIGVLVFALLSGKAPFLKNTPRTNKKTASHSEFSRPALAVGVPSRVAVPVFVPRPSVSPAFLPPVWKPTEKTVVQPSAPIPSE